MVVITNSLITPITIKSVTQWFADNGIDITEKYLRIKTSRDGTLEEIEVDVELTVQQQEEITLKFFSNRVQGSMGENITSTDIITLGNENVLPCYRKYYNRVYD